MMRALPKTLILSLSVGLTLATSVPVALAHGLGNVEKMPGSGAMEPGVMGEMGTGMMDLMGDWLSDREHGERPGRGAEMPVGPRMPAAPEMPMGSGMNDLEMPAMPRMPGAIKAPGMMLPGFRLQMAPGWSG